MAKRKKKKGVLWLYPAFFLLCLGIGLYIYGSKRLIIDYQMETSVLVNTPVYVKSLVKNIKNGDLLNGDDLIDTSKVGEQEVTLVIQKGKVKRNEHFEISVIDQEKPVISAKTEITSYRTNEVDLLKDVSVTDNSNEEILAIVSGKYDINVAGTYHLEYVAKDSSGNEERVAFTLKIIEDKNNYTFKTSKGYIGKVINGVTYVDGILIANKTYSLPSNYGSGLTSDTNKAFNEMNADAKAMGLNLWLSSGYRSYWDQNYIYNNYVSRDGKAAADTYSARAGHSEHQTGLAFDLNTISDAFANTTEGKWVADNCYKYGLILRYPKGKDNITGYKYESWHLRYVGKELASKLYNDGDWITLEEYYGIDSKYS